MNHQCSGESAAIRAGEGDECQCDDCKLFFPGGELYIWPTGNVCEDCNEARQDAGVTRGEFGQSPRAPSDLFTFGCELTRAHAARLREEAT